MSVPTFPSAARLDDLRDARGATEASGLLRDAHAGDLAAEAALVP